MHSLFAIEPSAVNNWSDFRYVFEKFGYSKGLLIAQVPKAWPKLVMQECEANLEVSDIQQLKITERLQQAKQDRLFRLGASYQSELSWIENIKREEIFPKLKGVMSVDEVDDDAFHTIDGLTEEIFESCHQFRVKQTTEDLAQVARFVVTDVSEITLVDPYFQPRRKCLKVLQRLIEVSREHNNKLANVIIYTGQDSEAKEYSDAIHEFGLQSVCFQVRQVDGRSGDFDMHARYLLTDRAGLNYDRGFMEPEDRTRREHLTQISCLTQKVNRELLSLFSNGNSALTLLQEIKVVT